MCLADTECSLASYVSRLYAELPDDWQPSRAPELMVCSQSPIGIEVDDVLSVDAGIGLW